VLSGFRLLNDFGDEYMRGGVRIEAKVAFQRGTFPYQDAVRSGVNCARAVGDSRIRYAKPKPTIQPNQPNQPPNQPTNQPTNHPTNQPTNQPNIQPIDRTKQPSNQPTDQPTNRPTDPTNPHAHTPTNRPTDQPTDPTRPTKAPPRTLDLLLESVAERCGFGPSALLLTLEASTAGHLSTLAPPPSKQSPASSAPPTAQASQPPQAEGASTSEASLPAGASSALPGARSPPGARGSKASEAAHKEAVWIDPTDASEERFRRLVAFFLQRLEGNAPHVGFRADASPEQQSRALRCRLGLTGLHGCSARPVLRCEGVEWGSRLQIPLAVFPLTRAVASAYAAPALLRPWDHRRHHFHRHRPRTRPAAGSAASKGAASNSTKQGAGKLTANNPHPLLRGGGGGGIGGDVDGSGEVGVLAAQRPDSPAAAVDAAAAANGGGGEKENVPGEGAASGAAVAGNGTSDGLGPAPLLGAGNGTERAASATGGWANSTHPGGGPGLEDLASENPARGTPGRSAGGPSGAQRDAAKPKRPPSPPPPPPGPWGHHSFGDPALSKRLRDLERGVITGRYQLPKSGTWGRAKRLGATKADEEVDEDIYEILEKLTEGRAC